MSDFPDTFLRGLQGNVLSEEGYVIADAFKFNPNHERTIDSKEELSVNWEDNADAVEILLNQKKEGTDQFQFNRGYVRLNLKVVNQMLKIFCETGVFSYERHPLDNNPYHGNLLLEEGTQKAVARLITNSLATLANNDVHIR